MQERELARAKTHLSDMNHEDYFDNFDYGYLISNKNTKIQILRGYCKPIKLDWPKMWSNVGYIEYLRDGSDYFDSEVKCLMISYGRVWRESQ